MVGVDLQPYYYCGTCHWWQGRIGQAGQCTIPATPSTVNCGETHWSSLCEQWDACDNPAREQAIRNLRRVAWLKRHASHRALWWLDGALSGPDPHSF